LTGAAADGGEDNRRVRILVIEDSPVVGPFVTDALGELGYDVVGPAPNFSTAREMIEGEAFDGALVDVFIRGERAFPLCDLLERKGVPFILTSGYADWQIPEQWQDRPRLHKPYIIGQLEEALDSLLGDAKAERPGS
jgi:CheY-like chemotaxis protein